MCDHCAMGCFALRVHALFMFLGNFMLQERKGRITHEARHWHECEPASLMLIMVIYDAICFASSLGGAL